MPDTRRILPTLTVERNLVMALNRSLPRAAPDEGWTLRQVYRRFPILDRLKQRSGKHLSGGGTQLVATDRALKHRLLAVCRRGTVPCVTPNTLCRWFAVAPRSTGETGSPPLPGSHSRSRQS